jgi:hypothetical protein
VVLGGDGCGLSGAESIAEVVRGQFVCVLLVLQGVEWFACRQGVVIWGVLLLRLVFVLACAFSVVVADGERVTCV